MARISLSGIVNENGISKTNYTGKGNGRLKFISRCGELWSNEIDVDDFLFLGTGRTTGWNGTNITLENEIVKWTVPSSNQYLGYRNNSATDLRNKTITTTVRINSEHIRLATYVYNGTSWTTMNSVYVQSDVETTLISKIPSNAQQVWIRIQSNSQSDKLSDGDEVYIEKWEMSLSPSLQHYTPITLASSSSIIQTGETATLTAELVNVLGEKMANTSVDFIEPNKTIFKDNGTTSSYDDTNWTTWSNYPPKITRKTEYTSIEQQTSGTTGFHIFNFTNLNPKSIEFDFYKTDGILSEIIFQLRNSSRTVLRQEALSSWSNTALATWYHIKFDFENKLIYCDNKSFAMNDIEPTHLYLACYQTTTEVRYKNFKVIADKTVTSTTNSQGVASTTIMGNGVGERVFKAVSNNVKSENMNIEDYIYYKEEEITSYSSDTNYTILTTLSELPSKFELSFDYKTNGEARVGLFDVDNFVTPNNPNYSVFVGSPNGSSKWYYGVRVTSTNTTDVYASPTDYHQYTIRRDGNTFYYQKDGVGSYSKNANWFDAHSYVLGLLTWGTNKESSVKNIILKTLE